MWASDFPNVNDKESASPAQLKLKSQVNIYSLKDASYWLRLYLLNSNRAAMLKNLLLFSGQTNLSDESRVSFHVCDEVGTEM